MNDSQSRSQEGVSHAWSKSFSGAFSLVVCLSWTTQVLAAPFQEDSDEFPIIMMSAELGTHAFMHDMGVDYVHTYSYPTAEYFNSAAANGLHVMASLHGEKWAGRPDGVDTIRNLVREYKDHPALGFWYLSDEPDLAGVDVSELTQLYTAIKEETPGVLVANAEAWSLHWDAYQGAQDMLMVGHYPVTTTDPFPMQNITHPMHFLEQALALDDEPVIPILQCFNWQVFDSDKPSRLPIAEELRYWSYASIAQGARGLAWYSHYEGLRSPGGSQWFSDTFGPVMREVRQFADAIAPAHHPIRISDAEAEDAHLSLWERSGVTWVVAVNNRNTSNTVSVSLDGQVADGTLTPWGTSADIPATVSGGSLQPVTLEPYEVRVWTRDAPGPNPQPPRRFRDDATTRGLWHMDQIDNSGVGDFVDDDNRFGVPDRADGRDLLLGLPDAATHPVFLPTDGLDGSGALEFDGVDDVIWAYDVWDHPVDHITIDFLMRPDGLPDPGADHAMGLVGVSPLRIFLRDDGTGNNTGKLVAMASYEDGLPLLGYSQGGLALAEWHNVHVEVTDTGGASGVGLLSLTVDGVTLSVDMAASLAASANWASPAMIGRKMSSVLGYFDGALDEVRIATEPYTVPLGDFDGDGDVDGNDFLVWQRGGSPNGATSGDLAEWQNHLGEGVGASAAASAVPEPTSTLLMLLGLGWFAAVRRR